MNNFKKTLSHCDPVSGDSKDEPESGDSNRASPSPGGSASEPWSILNRCEIVSGEVQVVKIVSVEMQVVNTFRNAILRVTVIGS